MGDDDSTTMSAEAVAVVAAGDPKPWKAEYAKSSRSHCRACSKPISKDTFRLGHMQHAQQFAGFMPVSSILAAQIDRYNNNNESRLWLLQIGTSFFFFVKFPLWVDDPSAVQALLLLVFSLSSLPLWGDWPFGCLQFVTVECV